MTNKFRAAALVAAAGALAVAVPAAAHPGSSNHPNGTDNPGTNHAQSKSHRCAPHNVAFIVSGAVADGTSMTQDTGATTWSGTLVVTVAHTNHWAKGTSGNYTVSNVKVKFDGGTSTFSTGEKVQVIGKLAVVRSHGKNSCTNPGAASTPTIKMIVVHPAAS
jgi:hypothetical protein